MKIGTRILATGAASVAIALVVGFVGVRGIHTADDGGHTIYADALLPIAEVAEIRGHIDQQRTALNRALLSDDADAVAAAAAEIADLRGKIDATWAQYDPAQIDSDRERATADAFVAARTELRPRIDAQLALLARDKAAAKHEMLATIGPALQHEADLIGAVAVLNRELAKDTYDGIVADGARSGQVAMVAVVVGAVAIGILGMVLRRVVMRPLLAARGLASQIRDGQLGNHLVITGNDELSDTLRALAAMDEQLALIVRQVR